MKKVYLAGAIWGVEDPFTWRRDVAAILPDGWAATDPLKLSGGIFREGDDVEKLIESDLTAIEKSEVFLARVDQHSWGTPMELFYAHEICIPTIGLDLDPDRKPHSPWLRYHCNIIVHSLEEVRNYIITEGWITHAACKC